MAIGAIFGGVWLVLFVVSGILFVVFGEVTVRRLRKDPATRRYLGFEFCSGWDIVNAGVALSWPRRLKRRLDNGVLSDFHANTEILLQHTSRLDRILGRAYYATMVSSCLWIALYGLVRNWVE